MKNRENTMKNDEKLPAPLTPEDCDLRGLPFMPLDTVALLESDFLALVNGDELKAALILWCRSWAQVPAGSLPDNDRVLAHLSMTGPRWSDVREMALYGWVKCSDGRLYHPTLAPKAMKAWEARLIQRRKAEARWAKEREQAGGNADAMPRHYRSNASTSTSLKYKSKDLQPATRPAPVDKFLEDELPLDLPSSPSERRGKPKKAQGVGCSSVSGSSPHRAVMRHLNDVKALTGRSDGSCRKLLGQWRKVLRDDLDTLNQLLETAKSKHLSDPAAWIECAIMKHVGKPVPEKHLSDVEKMAKEALTRATREWSEMFSRHRDFSWMKKHWPERARALGLPECATNMESYLSYYSRHAVGGVA